MEIYTKHYFEHFLQELGFETTLSDSPIFEPLNFSESVRLVPTIQEQAPVIDPSFEVLAGPFFKFDENNNHVSYYIAQPLDLETVKSTIRQSAAAVRWNKETTPIVRDINGKSLTIDTDRESRTLYAQALSYVPEDYSSQWKFINGFVTINKSDLQAIVSEVVSHVQTCFDWESTKINEINLCSSVDELKQIVME